MSSAQYANIESKYGNAYVSGIGRYRLRLRGWTHGHEYIDIVRGDDWLNGQIEAELAIALHNARKVPLYRRSCRDACINVVRSAQNVLRLLGFDSSFDYTLTYRRSQRCRRLTKPPGITAVFILPPPRGKDIHSTCAHGF